VTPVWCPYHEEVHEGPPCPFRCSGCCVVLEDVDEFAGRCWECEAIRERQRWEDAMEAAADAKMDEWKDEGRHR